LSISRVTHFGVAPQVSSGNRCMKHGISPSGNLNNGWIR
jgi:hypothetical protein